MFLSVNGKTNPLSKHPGLAMNQESFAQYCMQIVCMTLIIQTMKCRQPGKKRGCSITKSRFLDILDGLTAANAVQL